VGRGREETQLTGRIGAKIRLLPAQHLRGIALLTRTAPPPTQRGSERVAQAVEHVTFNHGVEGSSPSALTKNHLSRNDFLKYPKSHPSQKTALDGLGTDRK
jgi:hypothetical protein